MSLPEILVLEAFRYFIHNWNKYEIKKDPQDHATPVTWVCRGSTDSNNNDKKESEDYQAPS